MQLSCIHTLHPRACADAAWGCTGFDGGVEAGQAGGCA